VAAVPLVSDIHNCTIKLLEQSLILSVTGGSREDAAAVCLQPILVIGSISGLQTTAYCTWSLGVAVWPVTRDFGAIIPIDLTFPILMEKIQIMRNKIFSEFSSKRSILDHVRHFNNYPTNCQTDFIILVP